MIRAKVSIRIFTVFGVVLLLFTAVGILRSCTRNRQENEKHKMVLLAERRAELLVEAIIQIESGGDPNKVGGKGERGLMQIRAGTWRDTTARLFGSPLPFDQAFDPVLNRRVGAAYLSHLQTLIQNRHENWKSDERSLLLGAYNAGPARLRKSGFDIQHMPRQTQDYIQRASALHDRLLQEMPDLH